MTATPPLLTVPGKSGWLPKVARLILRVGLAGVLIYAGVLKVASPQLFADSIASFRLLPDGLINAVALGLPVLEIVVGLWLLSGWRQRSSAFSALVLCLGFLFALGSAAVRGITVNCGCFGGGPLSDNSHLPTAIVRDLVLLGAAWYLYLTEVRAVPSLSQRRLPPFDKGSDLPGDPTPARPG